MSLLKRRSLAKVDFQVATGYPCGRVRVLLSSIVRFELVVCLPDLLWWRDYMTRKEKLCVSLTKQYSKTHCTVTFSLPKEAVGSANTVHLVGDFNEWDHTAAPMIKQKNGEFVATLVLGQNRDYQFRYLIDGNRWENDWSADRYEPNQYGVENSVVVVESRSNDSAAEQQKKGRTAQQRQSRKRMTVNARV
jgi:1,4-alpha-glucan branching enzyme